MIPAYQAAPVIGRAVASALAQTAPAREVLVVDDGSTDDLAGALAPFGARVRLERIDHGGEAAARNAGIAAAEGEFVAWLDADDAYEPRFLEALAELAAARPDLDVLTAVPVFEAGGAEQGTFYDRNPFPTGDQREAVLRSCFLTMLSAVRTERLRDVGGFDPSLTHGADWDAWIRLVLTGSRAGLVREPLSRYAIHEGQATGQRARSLRGRVAVLEKLLRSDLLAAGERSVVEASLRSARARAALASAVEVGRRGAWGGLARDRRLGPRTRLLGVAGVLAPPLAARLARPLVDPSVSAAPAGPR